MSSPDEIRYRGALIEMGRMVSGFSFASSSESVKSSANRVLFDSLVAMAAGGQLDESRQLRAVSLPGSGPASVFGSREGHPVSDAAFLNGVSVVSLELDEGNKAIRGHASAHVLPAALAVAEAQDVSGEEFLSAFVAAHEVTSRIGAATHLHGGLHPHGNWAIGGAAAAASRLFGLTSQQTASAIDTSLTMAMATPFAAATMGVSIRNGWVGVTNSSGIWAATMVRSQDDPRMSGVGRIAVGEILGDLSLGELSGRASGELYIQSGYFKTHASCSYTHPPADLALEVFRSRGPVLPSQVSDITIETHELAGALTSLEWPTRLGAMFSIPYVVAVALRHGSCDPTQFGPAHRESKEIVELAKRVRVVVVDELSARLPDERVARLVISWRSGDVTSLEATNPRGDASHDPLTMDDLRNKAISLLGSSLAKEIESVVDALEDAKSVRPLFGRFRSFAFTGSYQ